MADEGKGNPFFSDFEHQIAELNEDYEEAAKNLIARNDVFYNKTLFRAFLNYSEKECLEMSTQKYIDSLIMLQVVLRLTHAPFLTHE